MALPWPQGCRGAGEEWPVWDRVCWGNTRDSRVPCSVLHGLTLLSISEKPLGDPSRGAVTSTLTYSSHGLMRATPLCAKHWEYRVNETGPLPSGSSHSSRSIHGGHAPTPDWNTHSQKQMNKALPHWVLLTSFVSFFTPCKQTVLLPLHSLLPLGCPRCHHCF